MVIIMDEDILTQIRIYFEKLLVTILHLQISIKKPLENSELLLEMINILLDEDDDSLLKQQLKKIAGVGIEHIQQDKNSFMVDFNNFHSSFISSNFNMINNSQEQFFNELALSELNITITDLYRKTKLKRRSAEKLLLYNKKMIETSLREELDGCNIEGILITIYLIADKLSILSSIIYSRLKLKEMPNNNFKTNDTMSLLAETLCNMNESELVLISAFIGEEKLYCDTLFNFIYNIYSDVNNVQIEVNKKADILLLFSKVAFLCKMDMLLESTALLYEKEQYFYIENLLVNTSGDFYDKLFFYMNDTIQNEISQELLTNLQNMYKKFEGFSSNNLMELIEFLLNEQKKRDLKATEIEIFPIELLKSVIKNNCSIEEYGVDRFLDSISLKKSKSEGVDYKNKISIRPLVKLKNEKIILTVPLLLQAFPLLNKRMAQQSFTQNRRLQKYFRNNYDEVYIDKIADELRRKNIVCWKNINLDQVASKRVRMLFVKGITREMDLAFVDGAVLYFVEYKNWGTTAFSIRNMLNEYKKSDNCVKQHFKAIKIVAENKKEYKSIFGEDFERIQKIFLIMVFQNPNAFKYLNSNSEVRAFSLNDFLNSIRNNQL